MKRSIIAVVFGLLSCVNMAWAEESQLATAVFGKIF